VRDESTLGTFLLLYYVISDDIYLQGIWLYYVIHLIDLVY